MLSSVFRIATIALLIGLLAIGLPVLFNYAESREASQIYGNNISDVGEVPSDHWNVLLEENITGRIDYYHNTVKLDGNRLILVHFNLTEINGTQIPVYSRLVIQFNKAFSEILSVETTKTDIPSMYFSGIDYFDGTYWALQEMGHNADWNRQYNMLRIDNNGVFENQSLDIYDPMKLSNNGLRATEVRWFTVLNNDYILMYIPYITNGGQGTVWQANMTLVDTVTFTGIFTWKLFDGFHDPFVNDNKIWFRTFARPLEEIQHVGGGTNSVRESLYGYDVTRVQPQIDQPSKDPKFDYTKIDRTVFNHWTNFVRPYSDFRHDWSYRPIYSFVSGKYLVTPYLFDNYTDDIWVGDEIVGIQVREISTRTQLYYYSNYDTWFVLIGLIITNYSTYRIIRIRKLGPTTDKT